MTLGNTFRAGLLAFGMVGGLGMMGSLEGCGNSNPYGDDGIPPLDTPDGNDTTLPDTPGNRFNHCFPPTQSLEILMDGRGAVYGSTPTTMNGGSVLAIDRESLSFLGGTSSGDAGVGGSGGGGGDGGTASGANSFHGIANWDSVPLEFNTQNPGAPGYGLMAQRTGARANGDPLPNYRRLGMTGSWAEQFPGFTSGAQLGFIWLVDGDFDPSSCQMRLRLRGAVRSTNGVSGAQPYVPVPLYSPRTDGHTRLAESTFNNEGLAITNGALQMTFNFPAAGGASGMTSGVAVICDGNCNPIMGSGLQHLEAQMVVQPLGDGGVPGDSGSHADAGAGGDGGLPHDAGAGG